MGKSIVIPRCNPTDTPTAKATMTFTGDVWVQPIISDNNVRMASVTFTPCARSHWHTHEGGQVLYVTVGSGWICDRGDAPQRIQVGDIIRIQPGTTHWHGADEGSLVTHLTVGMGETVWHEAVPEADYPQGA